MNAAATKEMAQILVVTSLESTAKKCGLTVRQVLDAIKADAESSTVKASIRIRKGPAVDASCRVVHGSTTYRVVAVLPDETERDKLHLVAEVIHG